MLPGLIDQAACVSGGPCFVVGAVSRPSPARWSARGHAGWMVVGPVGHGV